MFTDQPLTAEDLGGGFTAVEAKPVLLPGKVSLVQCGTAEPLLLSSLRAGGLQITPEGRGGHTVKGGKSHQLGESPTNCRFCSGRLDPFAGGGKSHQSPTNGVSPEAFRKSKNH